jgi:hypothetical protein
VDSYAHIDAPASRLEMLKAESFVVRVSLGAVCCVRTGEKEGRTTIVGTDRASGEGLEAKGALLTCEGGFEGEFRLEDSSELLLPGDHPRSGREIGTGSVDS